MGISGLLPLLRSVTDRLHLESLSGQTVAIDAYCWLHKAVYACASDLFHRRVTTKHIAFCHNLISHFLTFNISVVLVFDGAALPAKRCKEVEREKGREEARCKADELLALGKTTEATPFMVRAIDVTPEMAHQLIQSVKRTFASSRVSCIVAPYEADAQLAFLELSRVVDAVFSEDSDLLLFGVRRLCVKFDPKTGYFDEVCGDRLHLSRDIDWMGFGLKRVRQVCILSGCDYLPSISGMGLKTASRYLAKYQTAERVVQVLKAEGRLVPDGYQEDFVKAELVFCHQIVYNTRSERVQPLCPIDPITFPFPFPEECQFLGPLLSDELGKDIACGLRHPITHQPFVCVFDPPLQVKPLIVQAAQLGAVGKRMTVKRPPQSYSHLYFHGDENATNGEGNSNRSRKVMRQKSIREFFK